MSCCKMSGPQRDKSVIISGHPTHLHRLVSSWASTQPAPPAPVFNCTHTVIPPKVLPSPAPWDPASAKSYCHHPIQNSPALICPSSACATPSPPKSHCWLPQGPGRERTEKAAPGATCTGEGAATPPHFQSMRLVGLAGPFSLSPTLPNSLPWPLGCAQFCHWATHCHANGCAAKPPKCHNKLVANPSNIN